MDENNFNVLLPMLYRDEGVIKYILADNEQYGSYKKVAEAIRNQRELADLDNDTLNELIEAMSEAYQDLAEHVFTMGWDGNAPGCSGVSWIEKYAGTYTIRSSDYGPYGPYNTLLEALETGCFYCGATPDLSCSELSHDELVSCAKKHVVQMDDDGFDVCINERHYQVKDGELEEVEQSEPT